MKNSPVRTVVFALLALTLTLSHHTTTDATDQLPVNSGEPQTVAKTNTCIALSSSAISWWPGDGSTDDIIGISAGTPMGGIGFGVGRVGEAFVFDGVDDYVSTELDVQPSAMASTTWEAWVYPTRVNHSRRQAILSGDDGSYDRNIGIESRTSSFMVFVGGTRWLPTTVDLNQWQHIAVVYTPTSIEFYKNGVRYEYSRGPRGQGSRRKFNIGRNPGYGEYFQGMIDEATVYNRTLSASEIQAIFNAGSDGKCKPIGIRPYLTLSVDSHAVPQNGIATATVGVTALPSLDVTVALSSSNTSCLTVPQSETIPRNHLVAQFPVTAVPGARVNCTSEIRASSSLYREAKITLRLAPPRRSEDLQIDKVTVTQVFLDKDNYPVVDPSNGLEVPLIANKPTLVRAYVKSNGQYEVRDLSARLYIRDARGSRTSFGTKIVAKPSLPDPLDIDGTINFTLFGSEAPSGETTFTVELDPDANDSNNTMTTRKGFQPGKKLRIAWVPIRYATASGHMIDPDLGAVGRGLDFFRRIYPYGQGDIAYDRVKGHVGPVWAPFKNTTVVDYLNALGVFYNVVDQNNAWPRGQKPDFIYGWIPSAAGVLNAPGKQTCGMAGGNIVDGVVGLAGPCVTLNASSEVIFAHEAGHAMTLFHAVTDDRNDANAQCLAERGVDHPNYSGRPRGSIGIWGLDLMEWALRRLPNHKLIKDPQHTYDIMAYCNPVWISPYHYMKTTPALQQKNSQMTVNRATTAERKLLISGTVLSPTLAVRFGTFYPVISTQPPSNNRGTGFCLELRDSSNAHLDQRCFDLTFSNPETDEPTTADGFVLRLPYPEQTHSVVLISGGRELGRVTTSAHAPAVHLTSPNGGEVIDATSTYTVTWTADDADGDPLHFLVSYSSDGGNRWTPLAMDVTGRSFIVDSRDLHGSTNALFMVTATDGMRATEDVSDAPFTVAPKGPEVTILVPKESVTIEPDTQLILEGYATDVEDVTLDEAALSWSSDVDGELGTGTQVAATMSPGEHVITLIALDSDGNTGTASVKVFVGYQAYLPYIERNHR